MSEKSVLVLGVGNLLLGDEGVGVHVAQRLQKMALPPEVEVIDGGVGGFELIQHFQGREKVIIIDAVSTDAAPGTLLRFRANDVNLPTQPSFSAHQSGLPELLSFCQKLPPPPEVVIYGVAPAEIRQMSMRLSPTLEQRLDAIIAKILKEIETKP